MRKQQRNGRDRVDRAHQQKVRKHFLPKTYVASISRLAEGSLDLSVFLTRPWVDVGDGRAGMLAFCCAAELVCVERVKEGTKFRWHMCDTVHTAQSAIHFFYSLS